MYPLRFEPLFRRYVWGGHRLNQELGKSTGPEPAAESWEVVDHGEDQSIVRFGPLAGKSLRQMIAEQGVQLVGEKLLMQISAPDVPGHIQNRFPLLFKFLDANRNLSVQVHPDDQMGATLSPPDLGKTEAWYVMHAEPGSRIYTGLKQGVTRESFRGAIEKGDTESCLHCFEPKVGDCIFVAAGTIHAIGQGILIAEIQQASNTTFRVYDWGRVGTDGQPRDLHIEQALDATDFALGPVEPSRPIPTSDPNWVELVRCANFAMSRGTTDRPLKLGGDGKFRIVAVTSGAITVENDPSGLPLSIGETVLLPAALGPIEFTPVSDACELLEIHVP